MSTPTYHRVATVNGRKNDLPEARLVWLDSGQFVLDENHAQVAAEIKAAFVESQS